jgi:phosphoribosylformylglycinamidine (FGAM) synthase-like amidotransferase family enzyme
MGDPLGRINQKCGGCNQVNDVNSRLKLKQDGVSNESCNLITNGYTPLQIPLSSGNFRYVSDNSLFTRFKGLSSINQNYNDISNGGNNSNGSFEALMRVRHHNKRINK